MARPKTRGDIKALNLNISVKISKVNLDKVHF